MPRRKFIDKKSATTFQLVHRAQNDPLIHDDSASSMVFREMGPSQPSKDTSGKIKSRSDLESEYGTSIRPNEGEAANYGVYYDDTEYDYMQHIKDLGNEGGVFVPVKSDEPRKGKGKQSLDEALKQLDLSEARSESGVSMSSTTSSRAEQYFDQSMLPSEFVQGRHEVLRSQQDVPDEIAGFQPDMDSRLREVLEALEDEAYVDDTEDVFEELTGGGAGDELDQMTWEEQAFWGEEEDDEGWESDATIKASPAPSPAQTPGPKSPATLEDLPPPDATVAPPDAHEDGDWLAEYSKFKKDAKTGQAPAVKPVDASVITGATGLTGLSRTGKKRKGALTNPSTYSMTSSSLVRTEQHTVLDARFDKIEEEYADEGAFPDDACDVRSEVSGMSKISGVSGMSRASAWSQTLSEAPQLTAQFNSVLDDFLGSHNRAGKHKQRVRKGKPMSGLENLDEVRKGLGPARLNGSKSGFSVLRADT